MNRIKNCEVKIEQRRNKKYIYNAEIKIERQKSKKSQEKK